MKKLTYENIEPISIEEIKKSFALKNPSMICKNIISLGMYANDYNLTIRYIEKSLRFPDLWVKKSGIISLNHISRRFGDRLNEKKLSYIINLGIKDKEISRETLDVIEEMEIFNPPLYEKLKIYLENKNT